MSADLTKKTLIIIFLIGTIGFLLLTIPNILKSNNNHYCEIITNNPNSLKNAQASSLILDNPNEYFYEAVYDNNKKTPERLIVRTSYCFLVNNTGETPLNTNIINEEEKIITKALIPSGLNNNCYLTNGINNYLGVSCVDCNTTNKLIFSKNSISNYENIVYNDDSTKINTLATTTKDYVNCKDLIRKIVVSYIIFVTLILFTYAIVLGVDGFEELLPKWR